MSTNVSNETNLTQSGRSGTFLERLAYNIGSSTQAHTIFGEPVEQGGVTVIPVAKARWGFGGGTGSGGDTSGGQTGEGAGAGGGMMVSPVGYIELRDGKARFRPIYDAGSILQMLLGLGFVALLVLRGVRKLVQS